MSDGMRFKVEGSSPRMRGTLCERRAVLESLGIIPAYAGNTIDERGALRPVRDHPRVCGEHSKNCKICQVFLGSSPRMRGTHSCVFPLVFLSGIIPAYAGNTPTGYRPAHRYRDHPRVCGEHVAALIAVVVAAGSSPRMRGTPGGVILPVLGFGIIPAYAGNTQRRWSNPCFSWDHPRVCGEHRQPFGPID